MHKRFFFILPVQNYFRFCNLEKNERISYLLSLSLRRWFRAFCSAVSAGPPEEQTPMGMQTSFYEVDHRIFYDFLLAFFIYLFLVRFLREHGRDALLSI